MADEYPDDPRSYAVGFAAKRLCAHDVVSQDKKGLNNGSG